MTTLASIIEVISIDDESYFCRYDIDCFTSDFETYSIDASGSVLGRPYSVKLNSRSMATLAKDLQSAISSQTNLFTKIERIPSIHHQGAPSMDQNKAKNIKVGDLVLLDCNIIDCDGVLTVKCEIREVVVVDGRVNVMAIPVSGSGCIWLFDVARRGVGLRHRSSIHDPH